MPIIQRHVLQPLNFQVHVSPVSQKELRQEISQCNCPGCACFCEQNFFFSSFEREL